MGIVVCISLLMLLSALRPQLFSAEHGGQAEHKAYFWFVCVSSLIVGAWNSYYGFTHFGEFWGNAALVSGLAMMWGSLFLFRQLNDMPIKFQALRVAVVIILAASFLLYAITLIQLNLGFPYLGN